MNANEYGQRKIREGIWDMIASMLPESKKEHINLYYGVQKYEDMVANILNEIASVSDIITDKIRGNNA